MNESQLQQVRTTLARYRVALLARATETEALLDAYLEALDTLSARPAEPPLPQANEGDILLNRGSGQAYVCVGHGLRNDPILIRMVSATNPDEWTVVNPHSTKETTRYETQ